MLKLKYTENKSLKLTKAATVVLFAGAVAMTVAGPWLTRRVMWYASPWLEGEVRYGVTLGLGYVLAALALSCLVLLYRMLQRIGVGQIFVPANVEALRRISWIVGGAALVCGFLGVASAYIFLFLAVIEAFAALVIRVIRNAFGKAVQMQDELDLTV